MADAVAVYRAKPTQGEIEDVLGQRLTAALGTLNEDGSIHLTYLLFLYDNGRIYLETSSVTRKAKNAAARPGVSLLVDGRAATGTGVMVSVEGTARILTSAEADEFNRRLRAKYVVDDALDGVNHAWGSVDDVCIEITPVTWRSWTGSVLRQLTEDALGDMSYGDVWKRD
jgi:nitroimidazol reductase NimA-like FMN-containing flavoprotein (pyridoxamine 5'-phosphate oxidase superfamily)